MDEKELSNMDEKGLSDAFDTSQLMREKIYRALLSGKLPVKDIISKKYEICVGILEGSYPAREITPDEFKYVLKHCTYPQLEQLVLHNEVFNQFFNFNNRTHTPTEHLPIYFTKNRRTA